MYQIHFKPGVFAESKMVFSRKRDLRNEGSCYCWLFDIEILTAITPLTLKLSLKFKIQNVRHFCICSHKIVLYSSLKRKFEVFIINISIFFLNINH